MKPADEDAMAACEDDAVALHEVLGVSVILAGALEEQAEELVDALMAGEVVDALVTTGPA